QEYILKEVKKVYSAQSIDISDKHLEVMIKQMLKKVMVIEGNDSGLSAGQTLSLMRMNEINDELLDEGKTPAKFGPILLGISKSAVETDSFLSAASFQETTRVLTDAAVRGKVDRLEGLKENVIIGKLIPAGTGRPFDRETSRRIEERAAQLKEEREERARQLAEETAVKLPDEVTGEKTPDLEEVSDETEIREEELTEEVSEEAEEE
ncbi:MAG TPA: DNA-directed RNA polymerase subunit beta', partial [Erysipelotrichaceae bacterium]|nr:DNA-directed RNA polymerase subunit beta' [Erysipelotrichaceae bacterium]